MFIDAQFVILVYEWLQKRGCCCVTGRGGTSGGKFRISLGLPVGAVINCADNTGMALHKAIVVCLANLHTKDISLWSSVR